MARDRKSKKNKTQYKTLHVESGSYRTNYTQKYVDRKPYEEKDPNLIESFIPGVIRDIFIKKGQKVEEGQQLLILEAMKMKNQILSPMDGKIKEIYVKTGDNVPKNFLLLEFE
jgi:biotin carboxyl carrier protein